MGYERDNIRRMQGYTWGEQPEDARTLKLNTNENPYPPGPRLQQALASLDASILRTYPRPTADPLRDRLAELHGLKRQNVLVTHGGDEGLRLAMTTFVDPGATFAMADPSYSLYPVLAQIQDAQTFTVALDIDWQLPTDAAERINTAGARLTCLVNPHAPSGALMSSDRIDAIAAELNGVLLVDEAYVDFVEPTHRHDLTTLLARRPNLLLLRTFSKGYSLAGLRLGYLLGHEDLIAPILTKTRDSYNVDAISQALGQAAVEDRAHAETTWQRIRDDRIGLARGLGQLGLTTWPSETNFLLVRVPATCRLTARALQRYLKDAGVLVRHFAAARLDDCLRISVGTPPQNQRVIELIGEALND